MGDGTKIQWSDATWNCLRGCSRISRGCGAADGGGCYAEAMAARFSGAGQPYEGLARRTPSGPRWTGEVRLIEDRLLDPLRWQRPRRIFVNSMSDLFHERLTRETIARIFAVMGLASQHTFQCLTKRASNMRAVITAPGFESLVVDEAARILRGLPNAKRMRTPASLTFPLPNVWLGVSVEDQERATRIVDLAATPAAVRFISAEPLLGSLDLAHILTGNFFLVRGGGEQTAPQLVEFDSLRGIFQPTVYGPRPALDWVIVGGESGPGAREFRGEWALDIVRQCREARVACFVKQLGANFVDERVGVVGRDYPTDQVGPQRTGARRLRDGHGGDPAEWPTGRGYHLREFPQGAS